jgi:hypothetical protein
LVCIDQHDDDPKLDYASEDVLAESAADSGCGCLGLDSGGSAGARMSEAAEGDPIEAYAELIDRLARRIEEVLCGEAG